VTPHTVIALAPTGARRGKADHPALPISAQDVAEEAARCREAGASVLHLHVRAADGGHSLDPGLYRDAIAAVRARVGEGMLIQITTEAVERYSAAEQMAVVRDLKPEAVSVALREIVPPDGEGEAERFFAWMQDEGVAPQFILYAPQEVAWLIDLQRRGIVPFTAPHGLFVLGRYTAGQRSSPADLVPFVQGWPADWPWSLCAFGPLEARCMAAGLALGGHVRVGFENNLWRPDGTLAATNRDLVDPVAEVARQVGRPPADVATARAVYGATGSR
jgi:uncharacterized protein (DUF849 family)